MSCEPFDLANVLPSEWAAYGVRFGHDGKLYFAEWRAGFTVHQARAMFFECQRLRSLEAESRSMALEMEAMQARVDEAEKRAAFYRAQLRLESSCGAMLARIAGPL